MAVYQHKPVHFVSVLTREFRIFCVYPGYHGETRPWWSENQSIRVLFAGDSL